MWPRSFSAPRVLTTCLNRASCCRLPLEEALGEFLPLSSLFCECLQQRTIKQVGALLARTAAHRRRHALELDPSLSSTQAASAFGPSLWVLSFFGANSRKVCQSFQKSL